MTESTPTRARITLSGYLPGVGHNGLDRMADALADAFHAALDAGDESGETTRVVIVGILDVAKITLPADPTEARGVAVKFVQIEALTDADLANTARLLVKQAREARTGSGDQAIDGLDEAIVTTRTGRRLGVAGVGE